MGIHSPITSLNGLRLSAQTVIESLNPGLNHLARHPKQHEKTVDHPPQQDGKILRKEDHPTVNFHQSEKASIFFEAIQNIFVHTFSSRKAVEEKSAVGGRLKIHSQPSLRSWAWWPVQTIVLRTVHLRVWKYRCVYFYLRSSVMSIMCNYMYICEFHTSAYHGYLKSLMYIRDIAKTRTSRECKPVASQDWVLVPLCE